jgi:LDH2 family malate/lactate/ureidoglycolate dehydrogenase
MPAESGPRTVGHDQLETTVAAVLSAHGVSPGSAQIVAASLVAADLRGIHSHGVSRLGIYVQRLRAGGNAAAGEIEVLADAPAFALLEGSDLLSQIPSRRAVEIAVEKARTAGCATVCVRGGSHFGAAGYWAEMIAAEGFVGIASTNTTPLMAPWGGATTAIGTNPLAFAFPSTGAAPVVVDIATSETTWGALIQAAAGGAQIPPTWALGGDGQPTVDAAQAVDARRLLPFGRHKGYALAIAVELFAGALSGAHLLSEIADMYAQPEQPMAVGHVFVAVSAAHLGAGERSLADSVAVLQERLNSIPPQEGVERVLWPGQLESERVRERLRAGIPLPAAIFDQVSEAAREAGVAFPAAP